MTEWNEWRRNNGNIEILLERANLWLAHLERANLMDAHLEGADLAFAHLEGACFSLAILDDKTLIWECHIDHHTDFRCVGLGNIRIDAGTRALLEYNIRMKNWKGWFKEHPVLRWPVQLFWWISDYGHSTGRIMWMFSCSALFFAIIYNLFPNIMAGLSNGPGIHNLYISVTAMTSLGLSVGTAGDGPAMRYILLMLQYILGYVLLGALITRLSILFTAGGPSADFAPEWKPEKKEPPEQPDEEPASPESRP